MKKLTILMVSAIVCGAMLTSCGGSSGGNSKSGLKKSELFGNLPALWADDDLASTKEKERMSKVTSMKEAEKEMKKQETAKTKRRAAIEAEGQKIKGKDVPFTFSSALQAAGANYAISSVKVSSGGGLDVTIVASKVETNLIGVSSLIINYRHVAKDGSTILARDNVRIFAQKDQPQEFAIEGLSYHTEKMIDLASIEFLTVEEAKRFQ
jgi:hypothetical protein